MANTAYNAIQVDWEELREISDTDLAPGNWVAIGIPFTVQPRIIKMYNTTQSDIYISKVGIDNTNIEYIPKKSGFIYDLTANKTAETFNIPNGTQLFAKVDSGAPVEGKLVLVTIYGNTQY